MPIIIPSGFAHVVVEQTHTIDPEPMVNTFGLAIGVVTPDAAFCDSIMDAWHDAWGPVQSDQYSVTAVDVYWNQTGSSTSVVSSGGSPQASDQSGLPLPQNCAALVRKRTDVAGRRGRGRMYIPGVSEADVDGAGNLTESYQSAWQVCADEFLAAMDTVAGGMVILHRSEGAGEEPVPSPVLALPVERRIATQRKRLRP